MPWAKVVAARTSGSTSDSTSPHSILVGASISDSEVAYVCSFI